jgi:hypothetical protein
MEAMGATTSVTLRNMGAAWDALNLTIARGVA